MLCRSVCMNWNLKLKFLLLFLSHCLPSLSLSFSLCALLIYFIVVLASRAFRSPSNQWIMNFIRNWWVSARKWHHTVSFYTVVLQKWNCFNLWIRNFGWNVRHSGYTVVKWRRWRVESVCANYSSIDFFKWDSTGFGKARLRFSAKISRMNEWLKKRVERNRFDGDAMRIVTCIFAKRALKTMELINMFWT